MRQNAYPPGAIFCKHCGYCLYALTVNRCPECGHDFDPADSKTFRTRPPRTWPRRVLLWGGIPLLILAVGYAGLLGWLYWGWKAEAPARDLPQWAAEQKKAHPSVSLDSAPVVKTAPLLPAAWRWMILPACRPWMERVAEIKLDINRRPADLAERLAACRQLKKLQLGGLPLEGRDMVAICHLPELTELELWDVRGGGMLNDQALAAFSRLRNLQVLRLYRTRITDRGLEALANLPNLRKLVLYESLAVTDGAVEALCRCQGLKELYLQRVSLSEAGIVRLKSGLRGYIFMTGALLPAPATGPASRPSGRGENGE